MNTYENTIMENTNPATTEEVEEVNEVSDIIIANEDIEEVHICEGCGCVIEGEENEDYVIINGKYYCLDECCLNDGNSGYVIDDAAEDDDPVVIPIGDAIFVENINKFVHIKHTEGDDPEYIQCHDCDKWYKIEDTYETAYNYSICQNCYDDEYFTCEDCGNVYHYDDEVNINDNTRNTLYVCESCANDNYYQCNDCNNYFSDNYICRDDYNNCICHSCEENYYRCGDCGCLVHDDDIIYDDNNDGYYCQDCYNNLHPNSNAIHNYGYKPTPKFHTTECEENNNNAILYMGVELEVDNGNYADDTASQVIEVMTFNNFDEHVYCKHDSSLDSGFEIVSHPCTLCYHMDEMPWETVMGDCIENGFTSHNAVTCGLHVHVNRDFFGETSDEQDLHIAKLIMLIDKFWDKCVTFSRRHSYELNRWAAQNNIEVKAEDLTNTVIDKCKKQKSIGRYHAINLTNTHTVEFRLFRGTLKHNTFIATLQFVETLCNYAKQISLTDIWKTTWEDVFYNTEYTELKTYLKERNLM